VSVDPNSLTEQQRMMANALSEWAHPYAQPISFGEAPNLLAAHNNVNNATMSLISLEGKQIGITNWHVLFGPDGYDEQRQTNPGIHCQLGNVVLDPLEMIIDGDETLDLVTLDLSSFTVDQIVCPGLPCAFYEQPGAWPPPPVNVGDYVVFAGFPGSRREHVNPGEFIYGIVSSGGTEIVQVSEEIIQCQLLLDQCVVTVQNTDVPANELPGLSGSPVFQYRLFKSGVSYFDFVGIVFEYGPEFDLLRIRPSHLLNSDGTFRR